MENIAFSGQTGPNSPTDTWRRSRIVLRSDAARKIAGSNDLDHLKIFDLDRIPSFYEQVANKNQDEGRRNEEDRSLVATENIYNTTDKTALNYLKNHHPSLPYSINTLHLQNPYRAPQRLEGFAVRDTNIKSMYRSKDSTLRSRYNKNSLVRKESLTPRSSDRDDDKVKSSNRNDLQACLCNSQIGTTLKQYCTNSTLHGLRYVGDSNLTVIERLFWVISFIIAMGTATYYIWFLYQKWISTPVIISLSPDPVGLSEFPFPSVTICNMNNAKKSEAKRINSRGNKIEKLLLEDICNSGNETIQFGEATSWSTMLRFMINVSQSCNDMLHYCQWHGNQTECEQMFNPTMTDEGMCCNFNSVDKSHLFYNPRDWSDLNITFPYSVIDWNPETGYEEGTPVESIPWRPYGAGLFYGLTLVLDAQVQEYYCSSTASVGFKLLLHNPVETPKIADFAFSITPGEETRVIINPRISAASRSIIKVPQRKRKCFFTSERKLRYYRTYTQRNCILECEANFTREICDCVQYYMPKAANTPICGKKDDLCATKARRAMEIKLYDDESSIAQLNVTERPSCNCWPGCFEINYSMHVSQSKLMPTDVFNLEESYVKKSRKYFIENMAVVHLFFVDSQFTKHVKNELFGFTEFLSSTGGLLGLFMGFSFLSFMEILYYMTLRILCRVRQHNRNVLGQAVHQLQPLNRSRSIVYPFAQ